MIARMVMIELLEISIRNWSAELEQVVRHLPPDGEAHRELTHMIGSMGQTVQALSHLPRADQG